MTQPEAPTTTPNRLPTPESVNERAFTIAQIEVLRTRLYDLSPEADESTDDFATRQLQYNQQQVATYAEANGFAESHQKYNTLTTRLQDIVQTPDNYWCVGPRVYKHDLLNNVLKDADGNEVYENAPSGIEKIWNLQSEVFGSVLSETEGGDTNDQEEAESEPLVDELAVLKERRLAFAALSAKRQGRIAGSGGEAYAEAKAQYDEQMIAFAKATLKDTLESDAITPNDKKIKVTEYLLEEQAELRKLTIEKLKGTNVGRFVEFMTRGNIATRIAKGIGLGLAGGVVAGGVGILAGVAGAAAIGAGVAGVATALTRFARGYAQNDAKEGNRSMGQLDVAEQTSLMKEKLGDDHTEYVDAVATHLDEVYERDTKAQQHKRLISVGAGALSVAAGTAVGFAVHAALDAGVFHGFANRNFFPPTGASSPSHIEAPQGGGAAAVQEAAAQAARDKAAAAAAEAAKHAGIPSSDTAGVANAINNALGGNSGGNWTPGGIDHFLNGNLGTTELTSAGLGNFDQWANGYTVQPGDTIWGLSEKYLQAQGIAHPDVYKIDAVKDAVLADFQARGLVGANGWLSAGQSLLVK